MMKRCRNEEQGIISPSQEHGRLRYSPRDEAIARFTKRLIEAPGYGVEAIRMLKQLAEREIRSAAGDEILMTELALRLLYARKAFREVAGVDEERLWAPPPPPDGPHPHPRPPGGPHPRPRHRPL